jgi:hypothetical protein
MDRRWAVSEEVAHRRFVRKYEPRALSYVRQTQKPRLSGVFVTSGRKDTGPVPPEDAGSRDSRRDLRARSPGLTELRQGLDLGAGPEGIPGPLPGQSSVRVPV